MSPLSNDVAKWFRDGRGLAANHFRDAVPGETGVLDTENLLVFVGGPMAGFRGLAGNRHQVCYKTPAHTPETFANVNMGGHVGDPSRKSPIYACITGRKVDAAGPRDLGEINFLGFNRMI